MRRRPLNPQPVLFTRLPGAHWPSHCSYADIARRGERAFLYCDNCSPPLTIVADFRQWPWTRFLNYPLNVRFACPSCGRIAVLHLHGGPGTPGTDRFQDHGKYGQ
jgi:hypothetical protein